jgi:hypothetical protein
MMDLDHMNVWANHNGGFRITATFKGPTGEVSLKVSEALSERILAVCADEMQQAIGEAASAMTRRVLPALPANEEES